MTGPGSGAGRPRRLRAPGRTGRILTAVALVVVVAIAGAGVAEYIATTYGEPTLVVYTYPSLFGGPGPNDSAYAELFDAFAAAHHIRFDVEYPSGNLVSTLAAQANAPEADLVIGLDEITAPEAEARGLVVPYAPPELADVAPGIVAAISPDHGVVPYDWGYLALDYNESFYNATSGAVAHASFPTIAGNASWARQLLIEDPTVDITGEEFLVWQIEYYEQVLHANWTGFWRAVLPNLAYPPAPDWDTAFAEFSTPPGNPGMVVSYSTDPAYEAYYDGNATTYNATVSWANGTEYGWRTVYGVGIVSGSRHLALDQEFEQWMLSGAVQAEIPTSEWEYPANTTVALPAVYAAAIDPSAIEPLNDGTTPSAVAANLTGWVTTYEELADQLLPP